MIQLVSIFMLLCSGRSALIGKWNFKVSGSDIIGNFVDFHARLVPGEGLVIDGGRAAATWTGAVIADKTLIVWLQLNDVINRGGGSAINLAQNVAFNVADPYDSISWGLSSPFTTWIAESGDGLRNPEGPGNLTSAIAKIPIKMSVSWRGQQAELCQNDFQCISWTASSPQLVYNASSQGAEVMFGARLKYANPFGNFNATIFGAEIHNVALTAAQISLRTVDGSTSLPTTAAPTTAVPTSSRPSSSHNVPEISSASCAAVSIVASAYYMLVHAM